MDIVTRLVVEGAKSAKMSVDSFVEAIRKAGESTEGLGKSTQGLIAQVVEARKSTGGLTAQVGGLAQSTGDATTKTTGFWQQLSALRHKIMDVTMVVGAMVGSFILLAKQIYNFGLLGAQVRQTTISFDRLINQIDILPNYLERMREASKGTITDFKLMAYTMTLVAGTSGELETKLLNAAPRLLEIAKAANILNPALGDVNYMFESISQGVKRQERRILDNLGIIVRLREANTRYAEQMGIAVDEMTAGETQQAFLNETLRVGALLIAQTGGSTESLTDAYNRLTTSLVNVKIATGEALDKTDDFRLAVGGLSAIINTLLGMQLIPYSQQVVTLSDNYGEYLTVLLNYAVQQGRLTQSEAVYIQRLYETNQILPITATKLSQVAAGYPILTKAEYDAQKSTELFLTGLGRTNEGLDDINTTIGRSLEGMSLLGIKAESLEGIYAGLSIEQLKVKAAEDAVKVAQDALTAAEKEGAGATAALVLNLRNAQTALYGLQGGALAAARAQSILNAQLAGARAGFAGPFVGLIDSYTGKINALNDQLAQAGGGGGGAARKPVPVDMEEVRLKEAVAAADLRDAYHGLNEVEGKITEQEEMLAKAREEGADPAWIEYLEGSIQYLKDEQARAQLAIFEKKKALQELTDILNGVVAAEDAYVGSSGGMTTAVINLKEEVQKLNDELDKEIKKMIVMAAVNTLLAAEGGKGIDAALALGEAFDLLDVTSAAAIKAATLVGHGMAAGVIDEDAGKQLLNNLAGISAELTPIATEISGKLEMMYISKERQEELNEQLGNIGAYLEDVLLGVGAAAEKTKAEAVDPLINSLSKEETEGTKSFPLAAQDSLTALDSLDKAFGLSQAKDGGLYLFRVAIGALVTDLGAMLQRIKDAQALLLPGGGTTVPPGTPTPPGGSHGMDFTVPPGYPNDSFPIRVQSGEHVKVTPASQSPMTYSRRRKRESVIQVNNMTVNLSGVQNAGQFLDDLRDVLGNL